MKIIYITSGHFSPTSGAGITLWSLIKHISPSHQVEVYANSWEKKLPGEIRMHPLPPIGSYHSMKLSFFFPIRILCNYFNATRICRRLEGETDILHIYNGLAASPHLLITQLMCQKAVMEGRKKESLPAFLSQQTPKHLLLRFLESHVYRRHLFRKLVPASRFEKDQILRYYDLPPDDIIPVHGGVDYEYYNPPDREERRNVTRTRFGFSDRDTVALFVGYDFRRKGLPPLLRAMPLIKPRVKLLAVGGTGGMKSCRALAAELDLERRVIFTGPVYRDTRDFFFAADLFVFPTLFDPFGTVVLEAMAAGLPIITSRRVGAAELITPGKEGFLLEDPQNDREIAEFVNRLVEEGLDSTMSRAGQETARTCTWAMKAKELINLYENLI